MATKDAEKIREAVRARYAEAARARETPCCGPVCTTEGVFGRSLYGEDDAEALPETALATSFGCGNPTLLAELRPGEVVLDLGSGGGIDVLLSARRVAPGRHRLRPRHDPGDAGARPAQPGRGRRRERRVPRGHHRGRSPARRVRRRDHLQLRRQPVRRQARRVPRGVPRAPAGRPAGDRRRGDAPRARRAAAST